MSMKSNQQLLSVQVSLTDSERFVVKMKLIAFLLKLVFKVQKSPYVSSQVVAASLRSMLRKRDTECSIYTWQWDHLYSCFPVQEALEQKKGKGDIRREGMTFARAEKTDVNGSEEHAEENKGGA